MKRKFKILILTISVIAMLFAFVVVSSAAENSSHLDVFYEDSSNLLGAPSCTEGLIPFGEGKSLYILSLMGEKRGLIVDSSLLQEFCSLNNLSSVSDFTSYLYIYYATTPEGEYQYPGLSDFERESISNFANGFYCSEDLFQEALSYKRITSDTVIEKYNQGKVEGVEEFKSSEEYTNVLNNRYSTGYAEGIEAFKVSKAYTDALDLQYSNGKVAGVTEFKNSVLFANTLKAEYEEGYDAGVLDTQGVNTKNETTKLISILIGVIGFGILFTAVLSAVGAFKKKRAKRR